MEQVIKNLKTLSGHVKSLAIWMLTWVRTNVRTTGTTIGFGSAVLVVFLLMAALILPDRSFSDRENRMLQRMPRFSVESLFSGSWATNIDSYTADQFPFRDLWIGMRSRAQLFLGNYESNGVYYGDDGYLFQLTEAPDSQEEEDRVEGILEFADALQEEEVSVHMLVAPEAANIYKDKLPAYVTTDEDEILDQLKEDVSDVLAFVDLRKTFRENKTDQLYYRTDHHWTTDGAYAAYQRLASELDLDTSEVTFDSYTVSDNFRGTLASRSGFPVSQPDTIKIYVPEEEVPYTVYYKEREETTASLYVRSALKTTDQYAVFFGGNDPRIDIETTNVNGKCLLVLKDSYANSLVPFLIPHYEKIIMVDPRYYNDSVYSVIQDESITDVLFLYSSSTFFEEHSLTQVLSIEEAEQSQEEKDDE